MRKHLLEIIISLLITVGAALVVASGYLSYKSISSIVSSIHNENKPDEKLLLIRDIATSLDKAEDGIRIYAYSRSNSDLTSYKKFLQDIDDQIYTLQLADSGNISFLQNIDTISDLIEQKLLVWNEILSLYNTKVATQYLDTIAEQLESKVESDSLRKNRKFLKKIFTRQKKEEINEEKIINDIEQFKVEDKKYTLQAQKKEQKLAKTSSELTGRLYSLINKIKEDERIERQLKAKEADLLANETYRWIGWLSLSGTLSALLVILVLSIYIRKTRASQKALVESKLQTENLAKTKELFMANVSHEIRTPMNAISGFVDQLLKKPLEEGIAATLNIIKSSSDHLVRVINEVLDFSKLQSGKMKLESVHFKSSTVLNEIKWLFEYQAEEKQIEFGVEKGNNLPIVLFGDVVRLKQILINLISNAIKFTKEGKVEVTIDAEKLENQEFVLSIIVEDTGIGIDKENLENIFEDFTQAEKETARKYGGTGLGLSIVKKLIDLQNGTINVESIKNKGSRFTCKIPYKIGHINKVEEATTLALTNIPTAFKHKKALIADDEVYNRKLISSILKKWEISFDEAEDGEKAIELISNQKYDIVILDKQMPGADGLEVTKHIRKILNYNKEQTIIILSSAAIADKDDLLHYKSFGVDAFLPKPFTEELMMSTLINIYDKIEVPVENPEIDSVKPHEEYTSVVNLEELYKFAGNDMGFVIEMLNSFKESFEKGFDEINQFLSNNKLQDINNTAHKLASPCRHIGAEKLLNLIKKAESQSQLNPEVEQIRKTLVEIEKEYQLVKRHINEHLLKLINES